MSSESSPPPFASPNIRKLIAELDQQFEKMDQKFSKINNHQIAEMDPRITRRRQRPVKPFGKSQDGDIAHVSDRVGAPPVVQKFPEERRITDNQDMRDAAQSPESMNRGIKTNAKTPATTLRPRMLNERKRRITRSRTRSKMETYRRTVVNHLQTLMEGTESATTQEGLPKECTSVRNLTGACNTSTSFMAPEPTPILESHLAQEIAEVLAGDEYLLDLLRRYRNSTTDATKKSTIEQWIYDHVPTSVGVTDILERFLAFMNSVIVDRSSGYHMQRVHIMLKAREVYLASGRTDSEEVEGRDTYLYWLYDGHPDWKTAAISGSRIERKDVDADLDGLMEGVKLMNVKDNTTTSEVAITKQLDPEDMTIDIVADLEKLQVSQLKDEICAEEDAEIKSPVTTSGEMHTDEATDNFPKMQLSHVHIHMKGAHEDKRGNPQEINTLDCNMGIIASPALWEGSVDFHELTPV